MASKVARIRIGSNIEVVDWDDDRANEYRIVYRGQAFDFVVKRDALVAWDLIACAVDGGRSEAFKELRALIGAKS